MASSRRGPSVLVTDSRERPPTRGHAQRPSISSTAPGRMPMRFISVDNVLQYASEIPSGQPRIPPPGQRPATGPRAATRAGNVGGGSGGGSGGGVGGVGGVVGSGLPTLASARTGQQNVPSRTTKVSEKLVLIPETVDEKDDADTQGGPDDAADAEERLARRRASAFADNDDDVARGPLRDEELDVLRKRGGIRGKSYAERMPKVERREKLARLTAYGTAQAVKMKATAEFLRVRHGARTKLYDDCLYAVYHLPLLPGVEGYRVRSRPILKTPGTGKTVLDLEIERSERRDEHEGYLDEFTYAIRGAEATSPSDHHQLGIGHPAQNGAGGGTVDDEQQQQQQRLRPARLGDDDSSADASLGPANRLVPDAKTFAEMFVFSYGVVVFWNFSEHQEKDILADLTFAENEAGVSLVTRPLDESDFETEEFHFEYSADVKRPRVFNDMITLLPRSDHMVKLTISHAIAQSTKLCFFEERMSETMLDAQHVPKRLALTGELNMTRVEIVKILGRLFKSRVDINLSSNILDVPNFFWDSEPTLHPLYVAIREYLEIDPRIKVLNERCRVFLDLAEILSDSVADAKMSAITWIIIILIVVSIIITVTEVSLRFGILEKEKNKGVNGGSGGGGGEVGGLAGVGEVPLDVRLGLARANISLDDLRRWSLALSERERHAVCGADFVGTTYAGV